MAIKRVTYNTLSYLGNCYCGSVYLGYVSETDT